MQRPSPRFFAQLRPGRPVGSGKREIDKDTQHLYVCAFWRVVGDDGKTKQAGCSYSAEKHGVDGALTLAIKAARKRGGCHVPKRVLLDLVPATPQQEGL